jgi:hypothetical protein
MEMFVVLSGCRHHIVKWDPGIQCAETLCHVALCDQGNCVK